MKSMALFSSFSRPSVQQTGMTANQLGKNQDSMQSFQLLLSKVSSQQPTSNMTKLEQLVKELKKLLHQMGGSSSSGGQPSTSSIQGEQFIAALEKISGNQLSGKWTEEIKKLLSAKVDDLRQLSNQDQTLLIEQLSALLEQVNSEDYPPVTMINVQVTPQVDTVKQTSQSDGVSLHAAPSKQLADLWNRFEQIMIKLNDQIPVSQPVKSEQLDPALMVKLKQVLQQLADLQASSSQKDAFQRMLTRLSDQSPGQQQLLSNLLNNFTRKQSLPAPYQQQAAVTSKDVARWAAPLLQKQPQVESAQGQGFTQVMSKVEQYVIYVNPNQSGHSMQKQLMEQFEQLIKSNRLFINNAGHMEMNIRLKPQQLGDMTVRLVQLNGEMTVKILVSTQSAKEMLEGNIQQLRHMFSPQQVVIEKHDPSAPSPFLGEDDQPSSEFDERDHGSDHSQDQQQNEHSEEEVSFHELLMNEKV